MNDLISREYMKSLGATCIASRSKDGTLFPIVAIDELPPADLTHEMPSNTLDISVCVDKKAVKDALKKHFKKNPTMAIRAMAIVDEVPSVHTGFLDWQKIILTNLFTRKGKWIEASEDWRNQITWWECSECGTPSSIKSNFCPNCGADMRETGGD